MSAVRPGIRGKLIASSILSIAFVVALELLAYAAAARGGREHEERIGRYHAIHRLRVAFSEYRSLADRFIRDDESALASKLRSEPAGIKAMASEAERAEPESLDAFFEARAARRGIAAYMPLIGSAIEKKLSGDSGYYADYEGAERIAGFTDGYLSRLLTASMNSGEEMSRAASARAARARRIALAGVLTAGALSLAFSVLYASSISSSIRRLAKAAGAMSAGELEVEPIRAKTGDEVEILADSFNAMSANIRRMVEGLKEKAELERLLHEEELSLVSMGRELRAAQLANLQDQVRPHFLFNALNAISRQARLERAPVSEDMARGLGRLLRYAIASEGAYATLDEEMGVVSEYLAFQKIRFGDRLSWNVAADPGAGAVLLPRFTLQPVVENAVRHGIEPKVEGGKVVVSARMKRGRVLIRVFDTGVGMDRAERGSADGEGAGIGLSNLRSRLAFRYGADASISLSSRPGRGTMVSISIPAKEEAECAKSS